MISTIQHKIEKIMADRATEREREQQELLLAITLEGSTEQYLKKNGRPYIAQLAGHLTPSEFVESFPVCDLEAIERHLMRCNSCKDNCRCWSADDPFAGNVFDMEGNSLVTRPCLEYNVFLERQALIEAGVGKRFLNCSLDNYNPRTKGQREALRRVREYADGLVCADKINDAGLIIAGPVGTGKTHVAVGVLRVAHQKHLGIAFAQVPLVLAQIRAAIGRGDEDATRAIDRYSTVDVLALDDLGSERVTDWVREQLFLIINSRYEQMLPTIITTNDSLEGLEEHVGQRITSRIAGMCQGVVLDGPDYRLGGVV